VTCFATAPIERMVRRESPRLPWGATLVVVTAIVTDRLAEALTNLREAGRRLALVSLEEDPPPRLPGIVTYHLPPSMPGFRRLTGASYDATEALQAASLGIWV
jgi:hypothetical protein